MWKAIAIFSPCLCVGVASAATIHLHGSGQVGDRAIVRAAVASAAPGDAIAFSGTFNFTDRPMIRIDKPLRLISEGPVPAELFAVPPAAHDNRVVIDPCHPATVIDLGVNNHIITTRHCDHDGDDEDEGDSPGGHD